MKIKNYNNSKGIFYKNIYGSTTYYNKNIELDA